MRQHNEIGCPVCGMSSSWDKIVEHLAMADDPGHKAWRTAHKLPGKIMASDLAKQEASIKSVVMKESKK